MEQSLKNERYIVKLGKTLVDKLFFLDAEHLTSFILLDHPKVDIHLPNGPHLQVFLSMSKTDLLWNRDYHLCMYVCIYALI